MFDADVFFSGFCGKNDEELASAARENKEAANALILRYSKVILVKAGLYASNNADADDLRQEGLIALMKAVDSFDGSRGAKFSTYAEVCINNQMRTYLAKLKKEPIPQSLEDIDDEQFTERETPESIYFNKAFFAELWFVVENVLSAAERQVFCLCIQGHSYSETAEKLGMSVKSVNNAMQRSRRKIRDFFGGKL